MRVDQSACARALRVSLRAPGDSADTLHVSEHNKLPARWLVIFLALLMLVGLLSLQYRLWFADGSIAHTARLNTQLAAQQLANDALQERNDRLLSEVATLKQGPGQIEAHAREDLGLVKEGETFFMFVDEPLPESRPESRSSGH